MSEKKLDKLIEQNQQIIELLSSIRKTVIMNVKSAHLTKEEYEKEVDSTALKIKQMKDGF